MSGIVAPSPIQQQAGGRSAQARGAARLSIEFVLDVARISRGPGDLLDPLILTAILEANQAAVRRDPQLTRLYGDAQSALPDDLRRPISINALAKSLRLPFETVRRRLQTFVDAGLCVRTAARVLPRCTFPASDVPACLDVIATRPVAWPRWLRTSAAWSWSLSASLYPSWPGSPTG